MDGDASDDKMTAAVFEDHVGSSFALVDEPAVAFTLIEVTRLTSQPGAPREEPFSLLFTSDHALDQATYVVEHAAMGELALFLVPLQPAPGGPRRYEAVFN